jgi:hypothetical protein
LAPVANFVHNFTRECARVIFVCLHKASKYSTSIGCETDGA